jgi:hypothetical protein
MAGKQEVSRRRELMDRVNEPEKLDPTPMEIPLDAKADGRALEDMIQEQIAIQIAKKKSGA